MVWILLAWLDNWSRFLNLLSTFIIIDLFIYFFSFINFINFLLLSEMGLWRLALDLIFSRYYFYSSFCVLRHKN